MNDKYYVMIVCRLEVCYIIFCGIVYRVDPRPLFSGVLTGGGYGGIEPPGLLLVTYL